MIYKLTIMGGEDIVLENEEAVMKLLTEANQGGKLVLTKYGIVNVASISSIVKHKEKWEDIGEAMRYGKTLAQAEKDVLGDSPFAELLATEKKMFKELDGNGPKLLD